MNLNLDAAAVPNQHYLHLAELHNWPDIGNKFVEEPQVEFPIEELPDYISGVIKGIVTRVQCSWGIATACVLGSASLLAMYECNVMTTDDNKQTPLSLFILGVAESGMRKSSAFKIAFEPHERVDGEEEAKWNMMVNEFNAARRKKEEWEGEEPALMSPTSIRKDATIEALMTAMNFGRQSQMWAMDEAGVVIGGWAGRSDNQMRTMQVMAGMWTDGRATINRKTGDPKEKEQIVRDKRLATCWLSQPKPVTSWLSAGEMDSGYGPRTLLSRDTEYNVGFVPEQQDLWARECLQHFLNFVLRQRRAQVGMSKDMRTCFTFDEAGYELLREYEAAAKLKELKMREKQMDITRGFYSRIGEHAGRIAAVLFFMGEQGRSVIIGTEYVKAGMLLADWYCGEWERYERNGLQTDMANCYEQAREIIKTHAIEDEDGFTLTVKSCIDKNSRGSLYKNWRDPEFRQRLTKILEDDNVIRKKGRRHEVNPLLKMEVEED